MVREHPQHPDQNQVQSHDVIQQSGHHENQDAGDEGNERSNRKRQCHEKVLRYSVIITYAPRATSFRINRLMRSHPASSDTSSVAKQIRTNPAVSRPKAAPSSTLTRSDSYSARMNP